MSPETFKLLFWMLIIITVLAVAFLIAMTCLLVKQNEEIAEKKNYNAVVNAKLSMEF